MRILFYLLLVFVIFGGTTSAGTTRPKYTRRSDPGRKRNASQHRRFKKGSSQHRRDGILKRLDTMDGHFAALGVQIADVLENKKDIYDQLSKIKTDNVDRYEKMESGLANVFSGMNDKMEEMNQNIYLLMNSMLNSMRYMNDTMQNMQRDIKIANIKTNIAEGLGGLGNRGKVA